MGWTTAHLKIPDPHSEEAEGMDDGRRIEKKTRHIPGCAKPDAPWDDVIQFSEYTVNPAMDTLLQIESMRSGFAVVTAEFMRDATAPLEAVDRILDEQTR